MATDCRALIAERIRARGPVTVAEFMELALYHPEYGYYARASVRSGRAGDFFTSVDLGPLFGELLAVQIAEMWRLAGSPFDVVEAGAGNGRLARDVLDWLSAHDPACYEAIRLHLVERSPAARAGQHAVLGRHALKLCSSSGVMPERIDGVLYANELLDALPVHLVEMTRDGLREVRVDADGGRLVERVGDLSSPEIAAYLERLDIALEPGWRAEINLEAARWLQDGARRLAHGFMVLIDYGHRARDLYSAGRARGTLTAYSRHVSVGPEPADDGVPPWLGDPGNQDITAHIDLTTLCRTAEEGGLTTIAVLDQTYFLIGLGLANRLAEATGSSRRDLERRLAIKTLTMPGGLGSTHKVLIFGRGVGSPALAGCSFATRLT